MWLVFSHRAEGPVDDITSRALEHHVTEIGELFRRDVLRRVPADHAERDPFLFVFVTVTGPSKW